ncbi:MAG: C10 family peptidase [Paludibacteraceae bacterium]|nr:C10 family peptidase [Paludibacteraceae bacterium]
MLFNEKNLSLRKLLCSIGIVAVAQFMSCETDDVEEARNESSSPQQEQKEEPSLNYKALFSSNHTMGMDEARELALDAASLFAGDDNGLKSGKVRQVEEVRVLRPDETTLRSGFGEAAAIPDTLAYVCNFADSAGFAIICADDRVGCPILACVEKGTLGEDTDNPGLAIFLDNAQVFMQNSILKFEAERDSLLEVARHRMEEDVCEETTLRKRMSGGYYYLRENVKVDPMLLTEWAQSGNPYNNLMKECLDDPSEHAPAGCWAVAIGQLMAYYKYPTSFMRRTSRGYEGVCPDWNEITKEKNASKLEKQLHRDQVSKVLCEIGLRIGMNWQCGSSGASDENAVNYMKSAGYSNCVVSDYNYARIRIYLNNRKPVIMGGYSRRSGGFWSYSYSGGHTWVADGYKAVVADYYTYVVDTSTGYYSESYVKSVLRNSYLHINWGWGGSNNGYFAEGCFDTREGNFDNWGANWAESNYQYKVTMLPCYR